MTSPADSPPAYPHDPITEIGPDMFMVRGTIKMTRLLRISRNMAIIRHEGSHNGEHGGEHEAELSLIDPIRLSPEGEAALKALGTVKRIIRLGSFHGVDDRYYVETFGAELWSQPGGTTHPLPPIDVELNPATTLPFPDGELFFFNGTLHPECALLMAHGKGLLITCDSIQSYGDYRHNNWLTRTLIPFIGFPKTTIVGPIWLKCMTPEGGSLKGEFERLLQMDFDQLLSAHGALVESGAHEAVAMAVAKAFRDQGAGPRFRSDMTGQPGVQNPTNSPISRAPSLL